MDSHCARCGRSDLFGVLERFSAAGGGVNKIQHRFEIGVVTGLNDFTSQPFNFAGDIGREDVVILRPAQPFQQKVILSSDTARFFRLSVHLQRDQDAVIEMNALIKTLVHVCVSRQNQEFTVWVSDSDWTTAPGWIVVRSLLFSATVLASVARR